MDPKEGSALTHEYASRGRSRSIPAQGEALAARGMARTQFDWKWEGAEQDFKRALASVAAVRDGPRVARVVAGRTWPIR